MIVRSSGGSFLQMEFSAAIDFVSAESDEGGSMARRFSMALQEIHLSHFYGEIAPFLF